MKSTPPRQWQHTEYQQDNTKRDLLIDILKGYAIFLVIYGHSIQFFGEGIEVMNQIIGKYIYIFHMPLFFFMSAFVSNRSFTISISDMIRAKFKSLIIPLIAFSVISYILSLTYIYIKEIYPMTLYVICREFFYKIVGSYWFIIVLFFCILITNTAFKIALRFKSQKNKLSKPLVLIIVCLLLYLIPRPNFPFSLYITYLQGMFPFFITGWCFKEFKIMERLKRNNIVILIITIPLMILSIMWFSKNDFIYFQNFSYVNNPIHIYEVFLIECKLYIGGIIGIVLTIVLFQELHKFSIIDNLQWIGKETLGIYLIQGVIFNVFLVNYCPQIRNDFFYFLVSILITTACYYTAKLLKRSRFGSLILGK